MLKRYLLVGLTLLTALLLWGTSTAQEDLWPKSHKSIAVDEERIDDIMAEMTLKEKVAQLVMAEIRHIQPKDVKRTRLGGILNGGGAFPNNKKRAEIQDWVDLAENFHQQSIDRSDNKTSIPVIWGTDAVHGHNNVFGATIFPHNIGLGATRNVELLEKIGKVTAAEVAATGIFWVFAPTVAVPQNANWGRTYEGYSENTQLVADLGAAITRGMQGDFEGGVLGTKSVIATAKHFIGDGGTFKGKDQGDTRLTEKALREIHGEGYVTTLNEGVQTVMASFNSWNGKKLHGDKYLLTDVLKEKMGFDGFVIGDWNGHGQIPGCTNGDCAAAINAGVDMIMVPENWLEYYTNTVKQVRKGVISEVRLNDAVRRILRVKMRAGLFDGATPKTRGQTGVQSYVGNDKHRAVAKQAVKESLVLLKNNDSVLPLNIDSKVLVVGKEAKNFEKQLGGWSMSWQGTGNSNSDFPGASSILDGVEANMKGGDGSIEYSVDGSYTKKPDVAIMVFGEPPYAESQGDRKNIAFSDNNRKHLKIMQRLRSEGIKIVAVFLSGRPMWVNPELNAVDAFVAAWLPGSEAGAIAEVLFCDKGVGSDCDFKGKLSFAWPSSILDSSRKAADALFPYGFGLTYADQQNLEVLPEIKLDNQAVIEQQLIAGWAKEPYKVMLQSGNQLLPFDKPKVTTDNRALKVAIKDNRVQEDAQKISFTGKATAAWMLSSEKVLDLQAARDQSAVLSIELKTVKVDKKTPLYLSMLCGSGCRATIDFGSALLSVKKGEWQTHTVALSCLEKFGLDVSKVDKPVLFTSKGKWQFELGTMAISKKTTNTKTYQCP